jgi:hypothetical protein
MPFVYRLDWCPFFAVALTLSVSNMSFAQERLVTPDLARIADGQTWKLFNVTTEKVKVDGKQALRLKAKTDPVKKVAGLALVEGAGLATGTIELDLKGKNVRQSSFLGAVFNVIDERTFEAVYFRPFNFKADEPSRGRAVQYIAWPEHTWEELRKDKPGQFEKPIDPAPNPDGWFHAKIEVRDAQVLVFVNQAKQPCLTVNRLAKGGIKRPAGLFVDVDDGLYADLKITLAITE